MDLRNFLEMDYKKLGTVLSEELKLGLKAEPIICPRGRRVLRFTNAFLESIKDRRDIEIEFDFQKTEVAMTCRVLPEKGKPDYLPGARLLALETTLTHVEDEIWSCLDSLEIDDE